MDQQTPFADSHQLPVLIVSDDATFVGRIVERWGGNDDSTVLHVVRSEFCAGCRAEDFQLVVLGGMKAEVCAQVLAAFRSGNTPLIVIGIEGVAIEAAERNSAKVLMLPALPDWRELLIAMGSEIRRRSEAQMRARRIERANTDMQCEAALGRYMIDMRHNLNNALTSVLGNAELLLVDEARFSPAERKQIDTIRVMALRVHETLQRFSSLEKELRTTAGQRTESDHFTSGREHDRILHQDQRMMKTEEGRRPEFARAAGAD